MCYWIRQRSVCRRALSLSGDKMVIKTKSDTSNASLLLSFSAYCFFSPKHNSLLFPLNNWSFWKRIRMHIWYGKSSQYLAVRSAKMMWPINVFEPTVPQKLLTFRERVFSLLERFPSLLFLWVGLARILQLLCGNLFWLTPLLGLQHLCITAVVQKSLVSGASAPRLPSHPLSDGLNQNKSCYVNYSLLLIN